jgi:hypothetical protein
MKRPFLILAGLAGVLTAVPAFAQAPPAPEQPPGPPPRYALDQVTQGQVEAPVAAPGGVQFSAEQGESRATLRAGRTHSYIRKPESGDRNGYFDTWSLAVSAPLQKGSSSTQLASLDGLAKATTAELKFSHTRVTFAPQGDAETRAAAQLAICQLAWTRAGSTAADCDFALVAQFAPERTEDFDRIMWGDSPSSFTWGGSAKAGTETFDYVDPATLARRSTDETSWSAKAFLAFYWSGKGQDESLLSASYTRESSWKSQDEAILCPGGGGPATCVKGSPGPPKRDDKDVFSLGYRRSLGGVAFSLTANYDAANDVLGVELPVYLVRGADGGFTGGVKLGWRDDTDEVTAGVFVSKAFSLLEF